MIKFLKRTKMIEDDCIELLKKKATTIFSDLYRAKVRTLTNEKYDSRIEKIVNDL